MSRDPSALALAAAVTVLTAATGMAGDSPAVSSPSDTVPAVRRFAAPPAVRVFTPASRFKFEGREAVGFDLDAAMLGALSIADFTARLTANPPGLTLPFDEPGGVLRVAYDAAARRLTVQFTAGGELASLAVEPPGRPLRAVLRQRDQAALFAVPPAGGSAPLVWTGRVDYRLHLPESDQYLLCREVRASMGSRTLRRTEVVEGIVLDNLDEAAPVRVEGLSPTGTPFVHEYPMDARALDDRVDRALAELVRMLQMPGGLPAGGANANP